MVEPVEVEGAELVEGLAESVDELEDVEGLVVDGLVVDGLVTLGDVLDELESDDVLLGLVLVCASTAPLANVVAITTARVCNRM